MPKNISRPLPPKKINYIFWAYHFLIVSTIIFLLFNFFFRSEKIAYVDSGRMLNEFKGSDVAKKAFQTKAKLWQANIDTLTSEVKNSIKGYEKSLATMSSKEQSLSKQLIQTKQKQLADYQRAIQQNAKEEDGKLTQGIVAQINGFLSTYGKKHNYKLILIANQSGTIAYARDGLDITTEVLEELNSSYLSDRK